MSRKTWSFVALGCGIALVLAMRLLVSREAAGAGTSVAVMSAADAVGPTDAPPDPPADASAARVLVPSEPEKVLPLRSGEVSSSRPARAAPVHIAVLDDRRRPLPGAIAVSDDEMHLRSDPTDADGRTALAGVPINTRSITVWARRRFSRSVTLPALGVGNDAGAVNDAEHPLVVVLAACASLELAARAHDGTPPSGLELVLQVEYPVFASIDWSLPPAGNFRLAPDPMVHELGGSAVLRVATQAGGPPSVVFRIGDDGRGSLSDLMPDLPFSLCLRRNGALLWGPQSVTLQPGELRVLEVEVAREPASLHVHVVDRNGRPIEHVEVTVLEDGWPGPMSQLTDRDGHATLVDLYTPTVSLALVHSDVAYQRVEDVALERDGQTLDVTLQEEPGVDAPEPDAPRSTGGESLKVPY